MALTFRTLRSGSSGNTAVVCAQGHALLLDLGAPANTALLPCLTELRQRRIRPLAALVTHEHGDHFSPGPLRVMSGQGIPVHAPAAALAHARRQTELGHWSGCPTLSCYDEGEGFERELRLGPFTVRPIEVTHQPGGSCYAFDILAEVRGGWVRLVYATDLCQERALPAALVDADVVFLEANHDPELLRRHPNPSSQFHLANEHSARLVLAARVARGRPFAHVCLGHLSERRNSSGLAEAALRGGFARAGVAVDFPVSCAPRHQPGAWVTAPARSDGELASAG